MFSSRSRGFSLAPALVLVAVLGLVATGIEYAVPTSNNALVAAAPTAPATPANDLQSKAPKDCNDAITKALGKGNDGTATTVDDGKAGTLDTCYGAVLKNATSTPSQKREDYICVGRFGTATIENGKVTALTNALRGSKPTECRISVCKKNPEDKKLVCEPAKLFKGGISSTPPTTTGAAPTLTSTEGNAQPTPLPANQQKALSDAFANEQLKVEDAQQEQAVKVGDAQQQLDQVIKNCQFDGAVCTPDANPAVKEAQDKLDVEKKRLEELNQQQKLLAENQKALTAPTPPPTPIPRPDPRKDPNAPPSGGPPGGNPGSTFPSNNSAMNGLGSLLGGLAKALGGAATTPPPQAPPQQCSTDPNAYAQQQQQYQQALQQYNYQLQQYNYQQQLAQYNSSTYGNQSYASPPPPPAQPQPCSPSTGQQCNAQPQQPPASTCSVGYWKPIYSGVCIASWQCASAEPLKAELSCQPKVADAGMTLAISYSCSSGTASSTAFTVTTQPSGSATTTVAAPPAGTNTATYTLTCTDGGKTAGAQCSVQVGKPSIILVGNPKTVAANGSSLLGWITTGMKSCVVSSADQADFTARNSSNTSPNGTATTSPIASRATFLLHCETLAGGTREATTTIAVTQ